MTDIATPPTTASTAPTTTASTTPPTTAPADLLDFDLPCRKCTYNLRMLRRDARCPECNTPVLVSVQSHLLEFADPAWIARLARGGNIVIGALLGFLVMIVPATALGSREGGRLGWVVLLVDAALAVALLCGAWVLAAPNPALGRVERWHALRRWLRFTIALSIAGTLLASAAFFGPAQWRGPAVIQGLGGLLGISGAITLALLGFYVAQIARRVGERTLMRRAQVVAVVNLLLWAAVLALLLYIVPRARVGLNPGNAEPAAALCGLGALILSIVILCLPASLVPALRRTRAAAEQNWRAALAASERAASGAPDEEGRRRDPADRRAGQDSSLRSE